MSHQGGNGMRWGRGRDRPLDRDDERDRDRRPRRGESGEAGSSRSRGPRETGRDHPEERRRRREESGSRSRSRAETRRDPPQERDRRPRRSEKSGEAASSRRSPPETRGDPRQEMEEEPSTSSGIRSGRAPRRPRLTFEERTRLRLDRFEAVRSRENDESKTKQGRDGTPITLIANYFPVIKTPDWVIRHYRVDFLPDIERDSRLKKLLVRQCRNVLPPYIFDGSSLWTASEIRPDPKILNTIHNAAGTQTQYEITIRLVSELDKTEPTCLQIYNIIIHNCLQLVGLDEIGRYFYDSQQSVQMTAERIQVWRGYKTMMRQHEEGILLGVEITHKVLRMDSCLEFIRRKQAMRHYRDLSEDDKKKVQEEIKNGLLGSTVVTLHNRKYYKIDDIEWNKNPNSTFPLRDGSQVSFVEYYRRYGNMGRITDMGPPLLVSRPKKKDLHRGWDKNTLLIPELCHMTGLTDEHRENVRLMRNLTQNLQVSPYNRVDAIQKFMRRLQNTNEVREELRRWDLQFGTNLVSVNGKVLQKEKIMFGDAGGLGSEPKVNQLNEKEDNNRDHDNHWAGSDWTKAFYKYKMVNTVNLKDWVVVVSSQEAGSIENFIRMLQMVGRTMNFEPRLPKYLKVPGTDISSYMSALQQAKGKNPTLQMIFIVLPNDKFYVPLKKRCTLEYETPSQCLLAKNLLDQKKLKSIATKVAIQMNTKLGGVPWLVKIPLEKLMIVGFDVHHSGKGKNRKSVGAIVASMNDNHGRYYSTVSYHGEKEELSTQLCADFTKCLKAYHVVNGCLPNRIMFYRDGVGEGQLGYVYGSELVQIKEAITKAYDQVRPEPKFTFIVVTKRINTRIFGRDNKGRYENPVPGTVVDDVITLPERFDFYLISQNASYKTTVSPTSYNVLQDTQGLDVGKIQMLTYRLCHMYYNWIGTVAVPAPCQYAHKLAYLTGTTLGKACGEALSHKLHFL